MATTMGSTAPLAPPPAPPTGSPMWRVAKHEGVGNVVLEQTPVPDLGPLDVLVKTHVSLISRGSELWRRYVLSEAVNPDMMGYSTTGTVVAVGAEVPSLPPERRLAPGARVGVSAPHAEYSLRSLEDTRHPRVYPLLPAVPWEEGTFHPLATSASGWIAAGRDHAPGSSGRAGAGDRGQSGDADRPPAPAGAADRRGRPPPALPPRAAGRRPPGGGRRPGDPVQAVRRLTGEAGATVVIDCVGGKAGLASLPRPSRCWPLGACCS